MSGRTAGPAPHSPEAHFQRGMLHHQKGQAAEAERWYRRALERRPDYADALNNLALLLEQRGNIDAAEPLLRRAVAAQPDMAALHCNLGRLLLARDRLEEAAACFRRALDLGDAAAAPMAEYGLATVSRGRGRLSEAEAHLNAALSLTPAFLDARNDLGVVLRQTGRTGDAEKAFRAVIRAERRFAPAHLNLGVLLLETGRLEPAAAALAEAAALRPDWAEAQYHLGTAERQCGRRDSAEAALRRALALMPDHLPAMTQLAGILGETGRPAEAETLFRRVLAAAPADLDARLGLIELLSHQRRADEAKAEAEQGLAFAPNSADIANACGTLAELEADFAAALACYERAVALDPGHPDANFNRGRLRLHEGRWAEGWEGYEWRLKNTRLKTAFFGAVMWDGAPLDGKTLLLHSEQGLGDTLQFCRYVPLMAERCGSVVLAVQPPLRRLLSRLPGIASCHDAGGTLPRFDALIPLASLPRLFATDAATVPAPAGYLSAAAEDVERWRERLGPRDGRLRVGIAWAGNPDQAADRNRSSTLASFLPLLDRRDCAFYSLQLGAGAAELKSHNLQGRLTDLAPLLSDFAETAAAMTLLDLIITVDTSVAHLAGGLGRPCWVALSTLPAWRYQLSGTANPWYASQRLFRQPRRGDWASVIAEIGDALNEQAARATPLP